MERIIYGYADAFLALSHTESTAEIHLIAEIILSNKLLNDADTQAIKDMKKTIMSVPKKVKALFAVLSSNMDPVRNGLFFVCLLFPVLMN